MTDWKLLQKKAFYALKVIHLCQGIHWEGAQDTSLQDFWKICWIADDKPAPSGRRHASTCASHCLLPESTHLCLSTESQHQRLQWCCLLTKSSAYSAVSLCLHFCRLLSGIVWLLTGLDTSHPIFSWSKNDWHTNMFQLTASITTVQCLMNRCWHFPLEYCSIFNSWW